MFSFAVEEKSCYLRNPIQIFAVVKSSKTIFSIKFQLRFVPDARWSGVSARRGHTSTEHFLRPSIIDLTDRYFVYLNKFGFLCENTSCFKKELMPQAVQFIEVHCEQQVHIRSASDTSPSVSPFNHCRSLCCQRQ